MKIFIIKKYDLREQYRFFVSLLTLSAFVYLQKRNITHLLKLSGSKSQCNCNERIISTGRTYCIEFVLNSLPSLVKITSYFIQRIFDCFFLSAVPVLIRIFQKFTDIFIITLLSIWSKDLVNFRYGKTAILLCRSTQDNISHNIKCSIQCLRLIVPDITHLKSAF